MMFPTSLIWATERVPASCIEIKTEDPEQVKKDFDEIFLARWENAFHELEEDLGITYEEDPDYYDMDAKGSYPAITKAEDGQVTVILWPLLIPFCSGEFCDLMFSADALSETIDELQNKYPDAEISGYVAFPWSDARSGDVEEYAIGEPQDIYPKFAKIINQAVIGRNLFGDTGFIIGNESFDYEDVDFDELTEELENDFDEENYEIFDFLAAYKEFLSEEAKTVILDSIGIAAESSRDEELIDIVREKMAELRNK